MIERFLIMEPPSLLRLLFDEVRFSVARALNSIRRCFVLQGLRRYCPSLIPFFTTVYGRPVNLKWNDGSTIGTASLA